MDFVTKQTVTIENALKPLFETALFPLLLGIFAVKTSLHFLQNSQSISPKCQDGTSFCSTSVRSWLPLVETTWTLAIGFIFFAITYNGVLKNGFKPVAFVGITAFTLFFTLAYWIAKDVVRLADEPRYLNTSFKQARQDLTARDEGRLSLPDFAQSTLGDLLSSFTFTSGSDTGMAILFIPLGVVAALVSRK